MVKELCLPYKDSFRCIYIDRFYTSIDLLKELDKMKLYAVGTCMKNQLPKEVVINKRSNEFRAMQRGDYKYHLYEYKKENNVLWNYGLVCWKDWDIVYALTNCEDTTKKGSCFRRSAHGRICIERPKVIEKYNANMGGVDLADMRRMHCNSTIMGLHRWWLKLFFYLLDVGTSNALVLYREAGINEGVDHTTNQFDINIVEYKKKLILNLVANEIVGIDEPVVDHRMERIEGDSRYQCSYCSLFGEEKRRTRYKCSHPECNMPLCSVGTGRTDQDCFSLSHANEDVRKSVALHFLKMRKKHNNKKNKIRYHH